MSNDTTPTAPELEEAAAYSARVAARRAARGPKIGAVTMPAPSHTIGHIGIPPEAEEALAPRRPGRPAVGPLRSVRVSDEVWQAATETAAARGESVSEVIRRALELYVNAYPADIRPGVTD